VADRVAALEVVDAVLAGALLELVAHHPLAAADDRGGLAEDEVLGEGALAVAGASG